MTILMYMYQEENEECKVSQFLQWQERDLERMVAFDLYVLQLAMTELRISYTFVICTWLVINIIIPPSSTFAWSAESQMERRCIPGYRNAHTQIAR